MWIFIKKASKLQVKGHWGLEMSCRAGKPVLWVCLKSSLSKQRGRSHDQWSWTKKMAGSFLFPTLAGLMWHGTIQSPVGSYLVVLSFWDSTISFQRLGVAVWTLLGLYIHTFLGEHRSQKARWPLPMLSLSDSLCKTSIELSLFFFKWVAIPSSRRSSQPRDRTQISCIEGGFFTFWTTREAQEY